MGTKAATFHSDIPDSSEAGKFLGRKLLAALGQSPDALLVFASDRYYFPDLLKSIKETCSPALITGCSSAGEFTSDAFSTQSVSVLGLVSSDMQFSTSIGTRINQDYKKAAKELVSGFRWQTKTPDGSYRYALIFADALAGFTTALLEEVKNLTHGNYQFFGGGAGDDGKFILTHVFHGAEAVSNAVVALEIVSKKPLGIGVSHSWIPATPPMKVTDSKGARVSKLGDISAQAVYRKHALETGQSVDFLELLPFFLHNVLGIKNEHGYTLRVPLRFSEDESITFAADIPQGSEVCIMKASAAPVEASQRAVHRALEQLDHSAPAAAIFLDCVATRLRMGKEFGLVLKDLQVQLGSSKYVGCNTYGQIAESPGQFNGFHNCTAVVCIFPE